MGNRSELLRSYPRPHPFAVYPANIFMRNSHNLNSNRMSAIKRLNNRSQISACKSAHVLPSFNHFLLAFTACPIIHLDTGL